MPQSPGSRIARDGLREDGNAHPYLHRVSQLILHGTSKELRAALGPYLTHPGALGEPAAWRRATGEDATARPEPVEVPCFESAAWREADQILHAFESGLTFTNRSSLLLTQIGRACAGAGDHARAKQILGELERRGEHAGPAACFAAEILAALGDVDRAIDSLYASYRQRNPMMVVAGVLPGLDPLRGHRRFRELLMRMGIRVHDRHATFPVTTTAPFPG